MLKSKKSIIRYIIVIMILLVFAFYTYNYSNSNFKGKKISRSLDGIKYQLEDDAIYDIVKVEIHGSYKSRNKDSAYSFEGDIIIDGESCLEKEFLFDDQNNSHFNTDSIRGIFYVSAGMEEITMEIFEPDNNGNYKFSYDRGTIISAPCENKEEAVSITSKLKSKNID